MIIKKYKEVNSTQEVAKTFKNPLEWTVILAEKQTSGYGKEKRFWYSPEGGLYFSVILPKLKIEDIQVLTILGAFVVAKIIKERFGLEPFIKLPNDVYLNGKKICGILTENIVAGAQVKFSVLGVGLNTNIENFPSELKNLATSLKIETGKEIKNEEILKEIVKNLKELFLIIS